ncbi:MAG: sugar phosphate nucleotidyltransferase [Candidatus Woesearchaeota archaeon]
MKAIIPVAGKGTRLKPHTHSTPKPLLEIAGKPILAYIIDEILTVSEIDEIVLILGHLGKEIESYISGYVKEKKISFVYQEVLNGDGGAIRLGIENILKGTRVDDDLLIIFGDTLIDFNLRKALKEKEKYDGIIFAKEVKEPWMYGVIVTNEQGIIIDIEEKPQKPKSNLAVIGAYWFKSMNLVYKKILTLFEKNITTKGEYKLADAMGLMIKENHCLKAIKVKEWFDCGRVDILLEANKYMLDKLCEGKKVVRGNCLIIGPAYVAHTAQIENSIIGPYASIGENTKIKNCIIKNSIIGKGTTLNNLTIYDSVIGKEVVVESQEKKLNIGDNSVLLFE